MEHPNLIVNLNLAIDRVLEVEHFKPGAVHRAAKCTPRAGGKGINIARAFAVLGHQSEVMGLLGGYTGRLIAKLADAESINVSGTEMPGENRVCMILRDRARLEETVVNEDGPEIPPEVTIEYLTGFRLGVERAREVILTGSLPPGVNPEFYGEIVRVVSGLGKRVFVDAAGPALEHALKAKPTFVKINNFEAESLVQFPIENLEDALAACRTIIDLGAGSAVVTLGALGAAAIVDSARWRIVPPAYTDVEATGCGDAFLAGLAVGIQERRPIRDTLKLAAATASACARHGITRFSAADIGEILPKVEVMAVDQTRSRE